MKRIIVSLAFLTLAACNDKPVEEPTETVIVDDCPEGYTESGEPCK